MELRRTKRTKSKVYFTNNTAQFAKPTSSLSLTRGPPLSPEQTPAEPKIISKVTKKLLKKN